MRASGRAATRHWCGVLHQVADAPCLWMDRRCALLRAAWRSAGGGGPAQHQTRQLRTGGVRCAAQPLAVEVDPPSSGSGGLTRVIDTELRTEAEQSYLAVRRAPPNWTALQASAQPPSQAETGFNSPWEAGKLLLRSAMRSWHAYLHAYHAGSP